MQYAVVLLLFFSSCSGQLKTQSNGTAPTVDHSSWSMLLNKHVDEEGNVDYASFAKDREKLDAYLNILAINPIAASASKNERLAYYINLYNAGTVQLILENYPLKSIKDINSPWDKDRVAVGKDMYSLGDIEHKILRKMNEPRIHFAINCASYSCPKLLNEAFTADTMEDQLARATVDFINDPKRNKITAEEAQVSQIFKWFKKDFTDQGSLKTYLNRYANQKLNAQAKIKYLDYDWSLNASKKP